MTYDAAGCTAGLSEMLDANFVVFPVPTNDKIYVQVNGTEIISWNLTDMQGRVVASAMNTNLPVLVIEGNTYRAGTYVIQAETPYGTVKRQVVIE